MDAAIADQAGITGDHVLDVVGRVVTELASALGDEEVGHEGDIGSWLDAAQH
jgi:hypothetical protein